MITPEKMENLGYVVKMKGRNLYVIHDCLSINNMEAWGNDFADVIVYPTIEAARDIKRNFDKHKHDYHNIKDKEVEVQLMHKKEIMIAKLKGSKDE